MLRAVSNESRNHLAKDDHGLYGGAKHAAKNPGRGFGLIYWYNNNSHARHSKCEDTANCELSRCGGGRLKDNTTM